MNLMKYKNWFFGISLVVLIPGVISLVMFGLKPSIDFTGGSVFEFSFEGAVKKEEVKEVFVNEGFFVEGISEISEKRFIVKTKPVDNLKNDEIKKKISEKFEGSSEISFETVGPSIGKEAAKNAFFSVIAASVGILLYISYSFRHVPKPYSSLRFGISAIAALLHDAFVVIGIFSILGHFAGVEINALFITALLTVIGFSVHDTIVVFDRIRENLDKLKGQSFNDVVNYSLIETLNRSLRTSLTVIFTLMSLLVLGGETIRYFVLALLIGIISGTYSSIFNASPILVVWENYASKRR